MSQTMSQQCHSINVLGVKKEFIHCNSIVTSGDEEQIAGNVEGPTQTSTLSPSFYVFEAPPLEFLS